MLKALADAVREPRQIRTEDGGAMLALALHGLMVQDGFQTVAEHRTTSSRSSPAADWNSRFEDEWLFEYRRKGYSSLFALHCSLQAATGKMFVRASEAEHPSNQHVLGLLLSKYIRDPAAARKQTKWSGVLSEAESLQEMFETFISGPLVEGAIPEERAAALFHDYLPSRGVVLPLVMVGLPLAAVAAYLLLKPRPQGARP